MRTQSRNLAVPRARRTQRSGSLYLAVLGVTIIVSMIALSAMHVARLHLRSSRSGRDQQQARLLAASAIEQALAEFNTNPNWETDYTLSTEYPSPVVSAGEGTFTWKLENQGGATRRLDGIGRVGNAECMFSVDLSLTPAKTYCLLTGGMLTVEEDTALTASWAPVATNANVVNDGTITADVEMQTISGAGAFNGTVTLSSPEKVLPDPDTVFDYYLAHGTEIALPGGGGGEIKEVLLSPNSNPYGTPNADGIYLIDASGGDVKIEDCRIVGTVVVTNLPADKLVKIGKSVNWEPAHPTFPALLVEGNLEMKIEGGGLEEKPLDETEGAIPNLNPPGTPYQSESDSTEDDLYPSAIAGLIYCTGNLTIDGAGRDLPLDVQGMIIVGGACELTHDVHLRIAYGASFAAAPGLGGVITTGPSQVRNYTVSGGSTDDVRPSKRWGQYFKPNLPADVLGWRITSVEVWIRKDDEWEEGNAEILFELYAPDPTNMPDELIETVAVSRSSLPNSFNWHVVTFPDNSNLDPKQGICLTLRTTSGGEDPPANIRYQSGGVSEPDSALIRGDTTGWNTVETDKALGYRIHAVYTTPDGDVEIKAGSWRQTPID